jgi:hypothetical protein
MRQLLIFDKHTLYVVVFQFLYVSRVLGETLLFTTIPQLFLVTKDLPFS